MLDQLRLKLFALTLLKIYCLVLTEETETCRAGGGSRLIVTSNV